MPTFDKDNKPSLLKALVREPLVHFALIGIAIYLVLHHLESRRYVIDVQAAELQRIAASYKSQYGSAPTAAQMQALVDGYVREEIYVREGMALGLDRNDEIIRRRVAQKYEFLQNDRSVPEQPSERELQTWFEAHRDTYRVPEKSSFEHRYFAMDKRSDAEARAAATAALPLLRQSKDIAADAFPAPFTTQALTREAVQRVFGDSPFVEAVFTAPLKQWIGPIKSGFGWHDFFVKERTPAQLPAFDAVKDQVSNDMMAATLADNNRRFRTELFARYQVNQATLSP